MRIIELESLSGLDRATIRYYERENMIHPVRQENGYRDYTQEDLLELKKIKLLRQLGMPLHKIRQLQQGSDDIHEILEAQIQSLDQQQKQAAHSAQVCRRMQEDSVTYATMDPEIYLKALKEPPAEHKSILKDNKEFREFVPRDYHPFRHFFARIADMIMLSAFVYFFQAVILQMGLDTKVFGAFSILFLLLFVPIEAACYSLFGATPGKLMLGIRVMQVDGCKLRYEAALSRAFRVYRYGMGWGIPFYSIYRLWKSMQQYDTNELCWNDESEVIYTHTTRDRCIAWILAVGLTVGGVAVSNYMVDYPQYSGKGLTVAEFAMNFNNYQKVLSPNNPIQLQPDGTFVNRGTSNIIFVGEEGNLAGDDYTYLYRDGELNGITVAYESTGNGMLNMLPWRFKLGAVALFTSIEGMGVKDTMEFAQMLEDEVANISLPKGKVKLETDDYILTYELLLENCEPMMIGVQSCQLFLKDSSEDTYVKLVLTMEWK